MKVALVAMCKCENLYIKEWVEHYLHLGFDTIIICDNNDNDGEQPSDVIQNYIDSDSDNVVIENKRGITKQQYQLELYTEMYGKYKNQFDWLAFFDIDEFLILHKHKTVQEWLSQPKFDKTDIVIVNWKLFDDNGQLYYSDKPVMERFTRAITDYRITDPRAKWPGNDVFKSFVRGGLDDILYGRTAHSPVNDLTTSDNTGRIIKRENTYHYSCNHEEAQLNHYMFKTIEEYVNKKKRGYPNQTLETAQKRLCLDRFFLLNAPTEEKKQLYYKLSGDIKPKIKYFRHTLKK